MPCALPLRPTTCSSFWLYRVVSCLLSLFCCLLSEINIKTLACSCSPQRAHRGERERGKRGGDWLFMATLASFLSYSPPPSLSLPRRLLPPSLSLLSFSPTTKFGNLHRFGIRVVASSISSSDWLYAGDENSGSKVTFAPPILNRYHYLIVWMPWIHLLMLSFC